MGESITPVAESAECEGERKASLARLLLLLEGAARDRAVWLCALREKVSIEAGGVLDSSASCSLIGVAATTILPAAGGTVAPADDAAAAAEAAAAALLSSSSLSLSARLLSLFSSGLQRPGPALHVDARVGDGLVLRRLLLEDREVLVHLALERCVTLLRARGPGRGQLRAVLLQLGAVPRLGRVARPRLQVRYPGVAARLHVLEQLLQLGFFLGEGFFRGGSFGMG
jgi:hypothetical protein